MANKDISLRILINAVDQSKVGLDSARQRVDSLNDRFTQLRNTVVAFFGISIGANLLKDLAQTADRYTQIQAAIKLSTKTQQEFNQAQAELTKISQRTGTILDENVNLFRRVSVAVRAMGDEQSRSLTIVELIAKSTALSGTSAQTAAAGIGQLNQAFSSGVLRGEEFNSVMENTPRVAQAIADGLNVPIGKLREMAEAGLLSSKRVMAAIESQADVINAEFAKIPLTINAALTNVNTAWVNFVGGLDTGAQTSRKIAEAFDALARNMGSLAESAVALTKILAAIYGQKLIQGMAAYIVSVKNNIVAQRAAAAAAEHEAVVQQHNLQVQLQVAVVREKAARAMLEEARMQRALAATELERAAAQQALNRAVALTGLRSTQTAAAQTALQAALNGTAVTVSRAEKAFMALNASMQAAFSFYIGTAIGEWLLQFERVRVAGTYVAQAFALIGSGIDGMFSGISLSERWEQIKQINAEFDQIRANSTDAAVNAATATVAAEQRKVEAVQKAATAQAESFKQVQEATKALTAQLDADAKSQSATINQVLTDRLAAIEASDASEIVKDQQRLQAKINASTQELQLQEIVKTQKLALIDQEYQAELTAAQANKERTREIESQKRQAKLSVYQGVAEFYAGEVAKLSAIYAQENQQAAQARQQLQALAQNHQQALIDIDRLGMDERQKIRSEENEFDEILLKVRAEQQKGEKANQDTINQLLSRAKTLHGDLTTAAVQSAETQSEKNSATYQARERLNKLYAFEKTAIEDNEKAHVKNAKEAGLALENTKKKLTEAQTVITEMTTALNQEYALKIGLDAESLTAAQNAIAELTKPETKVITIVTQNAGQAAQTGGLIHKFATGGYTPRSGKLPGFGGGDKVKALLEAGEFIIRKEAVQSLGLDALEEINQGRLPNKPIKRASGGLIDEEEIKKRLQQKKSDEDAKIVSRLVNNIAFYASIGKPIGATATINHATQNMMEQLRRWGRRDLAPYVEAIMKMPAGTMAKDNFISVNSSDLAKKREKEKHNREDNLFFAQRDTVLEKIKNPLAGLTNTASSAISSALPSGFSAPAAVQQAASRVVETINVNLSLNGRSASGQFNSSPQTKAFLDELKQAGLVSA